MALSDFDILGKPKKLEQWTRITYLPHKLYWYKGLRTNRFPYYTDIVDVESHSALSPEVLKKWHNVSSGIITRVKSNAQNIYEPISYEYTIWGVRITKNNYTKEKFFKTKSQALKFAKEYMRKN